MKRKLHQLLPKDDEDALRWCSNLPSGLSSPLSNLLILGQSSTPGSTTLPRNPVHFSLKNVAHGFFSTKKTGLGERFYAIPWTPKERHYFRWAFYYITNLLIKELFLPNKHETRIVSERNLAYQYKASSGRAVSDEERLKLEFQVQNFLKGNFVPTVFLQKKQDKAITERTRDYGVLAASVGYDENDPQNGAEISRQLDLLQQTDEQLLHTAREILNNIKTMNGGGSSIFVDYPSSTPEGLVLGTIESLHLFVQGAIVEYVRRVEGAATGGRV